MRAGWERIPPGFSHRLEGSIVDKSNELPRWLDELYHPPLEEVYWPDIEIDLIDGIRPEDAEIEPGSFRIAE